MASIPVESEFMRDKSYNPLAYGLFSINQDYVGKLSIKEYRKILFNTLECSYKTVNSIVSYLLEVGLIYKDKDDNDTLINYISGKRAKEKKLPSFIYTVVDNDTIEHFAAEKDCIGFKIYCWIKGRDEYARNKERDGTFWFKGKDGIIDSLGYSPNSGYNFKMFKERLQRLEDDGLVKVVKAQQSISSAANHDTVVRQIIWVGEWKKKNRPQENYVVVLIKEPKNLYSLDSIGQWEVLESNYDYKSEMKKTTTIETVTATCEPTSRPISQSNDFDFFATPPKPVKKAVASSDDDFKF